MPLDRREREALDRHITGNYGEDQFRGAEDEDFDPAYTQSQEITDGMLQWEPGTLSTKTIERILMDAMADLWQDCYRRDQSEEQRRNMFREKVMELMRSATNTQMRVVG